MSTKVIFLLKGNTLNFIFSLVNLIYLSRNFDLEFIGQLKMITLYGGSLAIVLTMQLHSSLLYFVPINKDNKIKHMKIVLINIGIIAFFVLSCLSIISGYFTQNISNTIEVVDIIRIYLLQIFFLVFINIFQVYAILLKYEKLFILQSFTYGMLNLIVLISAYYFSFDLKSYLLLQTVITFFTLLISGWGYTLYDITRTNSGIFDSYWEITKEHFHYSLPLAGSNLIMMIASKIDRIVISIFSSTILFAKYTVVAFENPFNGILLASYMNTLVPDLTIYYEKGDMKSFWYIWNNSIHISSLVLFPMMWFSIVFSEQIITFMFGEKFIDFSTVFILYALLPIVRSGTYQSLLRALNVTKYHIYISFLSLTLSGILAILIYNFFSLKYVAISYIFLHFIFNFIILIVVKHKFDISIKLSSGFLIIKKNLLITLPLAILFVISKNSIDNINISFLISIVGILLYIYFFFIQTKRKDNEV